MTLGACVSPPTPQQMLDTGFRTPEMTFHTFQMGVRADLPRLEYRCLSDRMRPSQGFYREFRETDLKGKIEYWLGIPDAKVLESIRLDQEHHLLRAESHGYKFDVIFVRERFWQVWQADGPLVDEALSPAALAETLKFYRDEQGLLIADVVAALGPEVTMIPEQGPPVEDLTVEEIYASISEFRVGSEWKIDQFRLTTED
jgi:hypothetical protein